MRWEKVIKPELSLTKYLWICWRKSVLNIILIQHIKNITVTGLNLKKYFLSSQEKLSEYEEYSC